MIKAILTRRSVRNYKQTQIPEEKLKKILEAATYAPSARNAQDWHFLAIQNKQVLEELNACVKDALTASGDEQIQARGQDRAYNFFFNAPTLIIVSYKEETISSAPAADCALALQNIFLAAHSLGIGSCWINIFSRVQTHPAVKACLHKIGVPEGNVVYGSTCLGYNAGDHPSAPERKENTIQIVI